MRTVAELSAEANNYEFNPNTPFIRWLHTLKVIKMQALDCQALEDLERAYILYLRWADLLINKLPSHSEFKTNKSRYDAYRKQLPGVISDAEGLKKRLLQRVPAPAKQGIDTTHRSEHIKQTNAQKPGLTLKQAPKTSYPDLTSLDMSTLSALQRKATTATDSAPSSDIKVEYTMKGRNQPLSTVNTAHHTTAPTAATLNTTLHKTTAQTEKGDYLKNLFVPRKLSDTFLGVADHNTAANLETCGILCGRLNRNAYFVTDLVIPEQESTANSCQTTNEESLFDYVESRDLFILGWIHTHPTQSCFMSSVDLHTQSSYQIMLPEAVAIVCAPQHSPSWGAFRLTDPPGVGIIKECRKSGFHPHDEKHIYTTVMPGHMQLYDYDFSTKDLRA